MSGTLAKRRKDRGSRPALADRDAASYRAWTALHEHERTITMTTAKIVEITSTSEKSFEDAIRTGLERTSKTLNQVQGAWIKEQKVEMSNGQVSAFRVDMKVTFLLQDS